MRASQDSILPPLPGGAPSASWRFMGGLGGSWGFLGGFLEMSHLGSILAIWVIRAIWVIWAIWDLSVVGWVVDHREDCWRL